MDQTFTINCPHCQRQISLDEALTHQIQKQALDTLEKKHLQEIERAKKEVSLKLQQELKFTQDENERHKKELDAIRREAIELQKQKSQLADEKKAWDFTKLKELDQAKYDIRKKTEEEMSEKQKLKDKENEIKIAGLKKALDEAQRKASQGSQQLQGEALEIDFETTLRNAFPQDSIEPIGKGDLGADIRHVVKSPLGIICGSILWETKRTKLWSNEWIVKLKNDVISDKANIPAIISEIVPDEAKKGIGNKDGVWISTPKFSLTLATFLREPLLAVAKQKKIAQNKQTKAEDLYDFITSDDFVNQVNAMIEVYNDMQKQIQDERSALERIWKKREMQVLRLKKGVSGIYGSIEEIAGKSLPSAKNLELSEYKE